MVAPNYEIIARKKKLEMREFLDLSFLEKLAFLIYDFVTPDVRNTRIRRRYPYTLESFVSISLLLARSFLSFRNSCKGMINISYFVNNGDARTPVHRILLQHLETRVLHKYHLDKE